MDEASKPAPLVFALSNDNRPVEKQESSPKKKNKARKKQKKSKKKSKIQELPGDGAWNNRPLVSGRRIMTEGVDPAYDNLLRTAYEEED